LPVFFLFQGCSVKKNTWAARQYHNTTARYNVYFNGYESLKEGVADLSKAHQDNYNLILPVYRYGNKENATAILPKMDRAIEKASKAIVNHSMVFKREEYCRWIDDSYMLLGKAYFFKREYSQAAKTFDFVAREYKKKSIRFDAMIWLAKSYNYSDNVSQSGVVLGNLSGRIFKGNPSRDALRNFHLVYADYFIKMKNYESAIEQLEKSQKYKQKKSVRTRVHFILAQLYQREGELKKAAEHYRKVLRLNPAYEMSFNARINLARCYDSKTGDGKNIRKELEKMLRDEKNKEYVDQIYYALAEIELKEKDTIDAINYLKLSAEGSINNKYQKGMSYLRLGEIYFDKPDYPNARIFYDSTVAFLPTDYPDFKEIKSLQVNLADLVNNILTVRLEDSLQHLASLSEKERRGIVDGIIKRIKEEEELKRQQELLAQQANTGVALLDPGARTQNMMNQGQNNWYFNNTQTMSFGFSEFSRKWGQRKLEDLWRLSNKEVLSFDFEENLIEETSEEDTIVVVASSPTDPETYLKNIPTTPEMLEASNQRIIEALFNIGIIYRERIININKAVAAFENLLSRYPDNKYILSTYYYLYKIYEEQNSKAKEEKYKNLILNKFPESNFAQLILDPDYFKKISIKKDEAEGFYAETYEYYSAGRHETVLANYDKAAGLYKGQPVLIKFLFLKAQSIGKLKGIDEYEAALKKVVMLGPDSEQGKAAQDILNYLFGKHESGFNAGSSATTSTGVTVAPLTSNYKADPVAFHFFVIVANAKSGDMNQIRNLVSDHNKTYFGLEKLNTTSIFLTNTEQMITVSNFKDKDTGMTYYISLRNNNNLISALEKIGAKWFVVSAENYSILYKQKDVDNYKLFFDKNYLE